jgi:hypothetical protein
MITTTITSPKQNQNHKTNKQTNNQTLVHFPNKENYFSREFSRRHVWEGKGAGGTGDGYTRSQRCHFSTWELRDVDHGIWIPAREVSNLDWLAGWLSVCLSAFLFFARALACCGVCVPLFFLLALSESASPLRHKKDCFLFSTASKISFPCI